MRSTIPLSYLISSLNAVKVTAQCAQFSTNGSSAAKYDFRRFYDFRNHPSKETDRSVSPAFSGQSKVLSAVTWSSSWSAVSWFRPAPNSQSIDMQYTPSGIFIDNNTASSEDFSTYLSLHTTKLANETQLAAEIIYTEVNVTYASIRVLGRVRGNSGAVAGMFTYHDDTTESDIEILTRDSTTQVHYSNQPTTDPNTNKPIPGSTFNETLPARQTTSTWNIYRLDWIRGHSAWYVNNIQAARTDINVPDTTSQVILNMWSNGGNFSGQMESGDEAWFDVQWIELFFNTTDTNLKSEGEQTICSADISPGASRLVEKSSTTKLFCDSILREWWSIGMLLVTMWISIDF